MKEIFTSETFQMLSDRIDTFMEEHDVYDYDNVTILVEKVSNELEPSGYHWKATLIPTDSIEAAKQTLTNAGYVDFFVSSEEVRAIAIEEQRELTPYELAGVVEYLGRNDLECGLSETAIRGALSELVFEAADRG